MGSYSSTAILLNKYLRFSRPNVLVCKLHTDAENGRIYGTAILFLMTNNSRGMQAEYQSSIKLIFKVAGILFIVNLHVLACM